MGRVLVVEDDPGICDLLRDMFSAEGIETVCAASDREAYAIIPTLPTIRALLVDINLGPGTTGFDVARFARQVIPEVPVIYVTGDATPASHRAFGVPESAFVAKPFTSDELMGKVRPLLMA